MNQADAGPVVPAGTRLLHIGPHETGTTALQSAFHTHRPDLESQGVHYTGPNRQPMRAAHALTGTPSPYADGKAPSIGRWRDLVREVTRAGAPRVVISSEGFADAEADAIQTVARDLGASRLRVVVTLRPLASILPSQWQQYVQGGMTLAYDDWLDAMFNQPTGAVSPSFWHRHRHDELVARWANAVGPERVTVIVGDERDHASQLRMFEGLLGLREGTLVPEPTLANRSLTQPEVEAIRAFNVAFRAEGLGPQLHTKVIRFGAAELLKQRAPAAGEPRIETPAWAVERAAGVAQEIVAGIGGSGAQILGSLDALAAVPKRPKAAAKREKSTKDGFDNDAAWADIGATIALGVVLASGLARVEASEAWRNIPWPDGPISQGSPPPRARVEPLELARVSTLRLGRILAGRYLTAAIARFGIARPRN